MLNVYQVDGVSMKPFAAAVNVVRETALRIQTRTRSIIVLAQSEDEAYGRAMKAVHQAFPSDDGWNGHNVSINNLEVTLSNLDELFGRSQKHQDGTV